MPFIEGESLRARLAREGELPVAEAVRILRDVLDALAYAHRERVVHRDIKPDNVMLSQGHALVTDFGVAKAVADSGGRNTITSLGVALGTPLYMAPEQAAANPTIDHRADIYGVGVLAYEMLCGRTPFNAPTPQAVLAAHLTEAPVPCAQHRPAVPPVLNALVMRCLEKHPADRWQKADEMLPSVDTILTPTGGTTPAETASVISSGTPRRGRRAGARLPAAASDRSA
jgi:serine/threonine-protein kinase